ncbi:Helix-turn-helix domain-containing protein [Chitinophaga sp. CF118]|uniref:helix-turn-helix transcriptional regulator n=1 Tax=Chitinophaga sp. CF118 TaxID=1884367 RepID=UPI0008E3FC34|nr:helix-turn-helix transcriptional regulator [Chitinophaga sp. CF118]SFE42059.1 Helix-turn-helix domain-containing protein [Chitinophaga sp. CF118]
MEFKHFPPSDILKPYVKHYYIFESDSDIEFEDTVFPSGDMEVIFNLGEGTWESSAENKFLRTPQIELWGQITKPLAIKSKGRHTMLGIRFFTHSAAYFLNDEIGVFNNQVSDLSDIIGKPVKVLHSQLLETTKLSKRIELIESFLLKRLVRSEKRSFKIDKVASILTSIKTDSAENNISNIASTYGITSRYLQKIIYQHTGLSPKSFNKINRFQLSLRLIAKNEQPFTSIAYECGYFDQSHFIRDFKSFTGVTPSAYLENRFPVNQAFLQ